MTIEPTISQRGFQHMDPVPSTYGGSIRVYESSSASAPHLWVNIVCPVDLNDPDGPTIDAVVHLTLPSAELLRDQLTYLIDHAPDTPCGVLPDDVPIFCRAGCPTVAHLPYVREEYGDVLDITAAEGWAFTTDDGWLCPAHA